MLFQIPFYKQIEKNDCGPVALKMVLEYLGEKHEVDELKRLVEPESSGATWTIALAKSAAELGFPTELYTLSLGFNPENYDIDFYKRETDGADSAKIKLERMKSEAIRFKVNMHEKEITLPEILSKLSQSCACIVLLDWSKIKGTKEFAGHFVPIVGYDDENIYVHNQGLFHPRERLAIPRDVFEEARKANGSDEDILFIFRKSL